MSFYLQMIHHVLRSYCSVYYYAGRPRSLGHVQLVGIAIHV